MKGFIFIVCCLTLAWLGCSSESSDIKVWGDAGQDVAQGGTGTAGTAGVAGQDAGTGGSAGQESDDLYQYCVDEINKYRATEGLPPYTRWKDNEACVDKQVTSDSWSDVAHEAFVKGPSCGSAQVECPTFGENKKGIASCVKMMWEEKNNKEGEQGHYEILSDPNLTMAACGFSDNTSQGWR